MNQLIEGGKGVGVLAIAVVIILAVLQGFQTTGALGTCNLTNTTANTGSCTASINFVSGMSEFGTFASVIVLAIVGFYIINYVSKAN